MSTDTMLTIEALSDQEEEQCRIYAASEIRAIFRHILRNNTKVALYYQHRQSLLLTTLLDFDPQTLYLDLSNNETVTDQVIDSKEVILVSTHHQVKIQFSVSKLEKTEHQGTPCFKVPMPDSVLRLQRREYFRLNTLDENPVKCLLAIEQDGQTTPVELTVFNISLGGLCLIYDPEQTPLISQHQYAYQLTLPGLDKISGTLQVKMLMPDPSVDENGNPSELKCAGCEFHKLERQAELKLQRFITNMQRQL